MSHCDNCVNAGKKQEHVETGTRGKIAGIECYLSGSGSNYIIISTDVFGIEFINNRRIADEYAAAGFNVILPNMFADCLDGTLPIEKLRPLFGEWMARNPMNVAIEKILAVTKEIKEKNDSKTIQGIGFCYGAQPVLAQIRSGYLNAAIEPHPSQLKEEDIETFNKVPTFFICAETDDSFPTTADGLQKKYEAKLAESNGHKFVVYKGVSHGFAARPQDEAAIKQRNQAHLDAIAFFKTHAK